MAMNIGEPTSSQAASAAVIIPWSEMLYAGTAKRCARAGASRSVPESSMGVRSFG